jgi:4-aminobutyrate aminotransferase
MVARASIMESWGKGAHGTTFGGNPVSCAAALATIELLEGGLIDNARGRGEQAIRGLAAIAEAHRGLVREVRGRGLMIGIELATTVAAEEVQWACFERGLLVLEAGRSAVRLSPPLVVTEAEVTSAIRILAEAVSEVAARGPAIAREAEAAGAGPATEGDVGG